MSIYLSRIIWSSCQGLFCDNDWLIIIHLPYIFLICSKLWRAGFRLFCISQSNPDFKCIKWDQHTCPLVTSVNSSVGVPVKFLSGPAGRPWSVQLHCSDPSRAREWGSREGVLWTPACGGAGGWYKIWKVHPGKCLSEILLFFRSLFWWIHSNQLSPP